MTTCIENPAQWPLERKINPGMGTTWDAWGAFVDDTPELARAILSYLPMDTPDTRERSVLAVWQWAKASGAETATIGRYQGGELDLRWYPLSGHSCLIMGNGERSQWREAGKDEQDNLAAPYKAFREIFCEDEAQAQLLASKLDPELVQLAEKIRQAERHWFRTSPDAPVVQAHFQAQFEDPNRGDIHNVDDTTWDWEATQDLLEAPAGKRTLMMEKDQYESDVLRDSHAAHPDARNWDGPYWVEATLHPPSEELRAWRIAKALDRDTQPALDAGKRPRL